MPEKDYSKGKIYRIWCITGESDDVYVGSTIQPLHQRWAGHKRHSKQERRQHLKLYQAIAGNLSAWKIELIELYPCASKIELNRREGELIRETGTLNTNIAGRTQKEHYVDNREVIVERAKAYYQRNTEAIVEKQRQYRQQIAEVRNEKARQYYHQNAEAIKERALQRYQLNAEALKEKARQRYHKKKAEAQAQ